MVEKKLPETLVKIIRNEVKNGKTKIQVSFEYGLSYYLVKKHTQDIPTVLRISVELEEKIRNMVRNGKSIREISKELNVCRDTVIKYTRDIPSRWKKSCRSQEEIKQIRDRVKKYNSRYKTAKIMKLSYSTIYSHTWDIKIKRGLSDEQIKKIRKEVIGGKSKKQVSEENKISYGLVLKHTRDIPVKIFSRRRKTTDQGITGKNLEILKQLLINGYHICSNGDVNRYISLKKYFPSIQKVTINRRSILFLEDKSDIAAQAFISRSKKKIMSYQELSRINKVFDTKLEKKKRQR